ncbi:hypothetical protein GZ77_03100 [Endozoicomonas montiporae]|uniref:Uncharacterized protein n=2 Tax=Endozoicomonas montiporae TaxID=1027273 RepID=A0A081NAY0_9GAMM|nr:hypothetical protein [Endozoicomonas montiporae]AMO56694.1 hypothetical protein EZMO1_2627 [Endozoicomonas montiporae CL-33]KEQ15603.1 hypothetical protein GZ77_03100 [Endozoicomonas montiporae]
MILRLITAMSLIVVATPAFSLTTVSSMAKENGINQCYSRIKSVADFYIEDKKHGTHAKWIDDIDVDSRLYDALSVKDYSDGDSHIRIIAAPNGESGCDTSYSETFVLDQPCIIARDEVFNNWEFTGSLNNQTTVLQTKDGNANAYLTPQLNGKACMVTRTEISFRNKVE